MKLTRFWVVLVLTIALLISGSSAVLAANAQGQTKIAPTEAAPPHPFTIIDTPEGRLVDGSVAVFRLNGVETVISLDTHKPYKTAQGKLPAGMDGGDYDVSVRTPSGTEFVVGMFKVLAPVAVPTAPTISPTSGPSGSQFTIYDPQGRMSLTDEVMFYQYGEDPTSGTPATNVTISADGATLTGTVPYGLAENVQHYVSVRYLFSPFFADLAFFVTF